MICSCSQVTSVKTTQLNRKKEKTELLTKRKRKFCNFQKLESGRRSNRLFLLDRHLPKRLLLKSHHNLDFVETSRIFSRAAKSKKHSEQTALKLPKSRLKRTTRKNYLLYKYCSILECGIDATTSNWLILRTNLCYAPLKKKSYFVI